MENREVLSGTFNGLSRLEMCVLNVLAGATEGALFGVFDDYRTYLRKLRSMRPPLAERSWSLLPWNAVWRITAEGRKSLREFGHNPHFEWEHVPGVVDIDPREIGS